MYKACIILGASLALTACGDRSNSNKTLPVTLAPIKNKLDKRIYLKDLTTGDSINKKGFPKHAVISDKFLLIDYSYFGSDRLFSVYTNADKRVIKYSFNFEKDASAMKSAIEEKLSIENKKEIKFDCLVKPFAVDQIKFDEKICTLISGSQTLTINEKILLTEKPSNISFSDWSAVSFPSQLMLEEDIDLSDAIKAKLLKESIEENNARDREKTRIKKDI